MPTIAPSTARIIGGAGGGIGGALLSDYLKQHNII
jgi:hypothetical protein